MPKEPTVITVKECELDQYGNLNVTDNLGVVTRINKKHESLHPLFQDNYGRAIKLIWANFKDKDYVDKAELFDGEPDKQVETIHPIHPSTVPQPVRVEAPPALKPQEPAPQAVGMLIKEIGEHIRTNTLFDIFGETVGNSLIMWYRSQVLGITRITFDGKDLPKFGE